MIDGGNIKGSNNTKPKESDCLSIIDEEGNELILFNDNINTFDYVIDCLVKICKLSFEQASTCANIAHYKGLCAIKHGAYDELKIMYNALIDKGLKIDLR